METGKHDETEDENKLDGEKLIEERSKEVETPKDDPKGNQEARRLWVDVISENRNPTKGRMMSYVAPKMVEGQIEIEIEDEDIESEIRYWENALILYVLGGDLSMNTIKNFMERNWNFVQLPDLYYHDDGYFLLRFKSHDDMEVVVMKGPYTIRSMPVVLKEWRPDFSLKQDMLRTIQIWIKLPKLPLYLWGERSLNKIGSAIGTPMVTDECTTHKLRVSYARMLVEVDITRKLVEEIAIKDKDGRKMMQPIEYEWRPKFCDKCQKIGHQCGNRVKKKKWQPKPQQERKHEIPVEVSTPRKETTTSKANGDEGKTWIRTTKDDEEMWTKVSKASKDRGKSITYTESSNTVHCTNGFRVLEVLNGPQAFDRGP